MVPLKIPVAFYVRQQPQPVTFLVTQCEGAQSVALGSTGKGGTRTLDPGIMRPRDGYSLDAVLATYVEYNVDHIPHSTPQP